MTSEELESTKEFKLVTFVSDLFWIIIELIVFVQFANAFWNDQYDQAAVYVCMLGWFEVSRTRKQIKEIKKSLSL